jgi:HEAT repeat protein
VLLSVWLACASGCGSSVMGLSEQRQLRTEAIRCLKTLSLDDSALVRCRALEALSEVAAKQAVEEFKIRLVDEYWGVRFEACVGLGQARASYARSDLRKLLKDPRDAVRAAAIYGLHLGGDQSETTQLAAMLLSHKEATVRRLVAQLLGRLGESKSVKLLSIAIKDRDEGVRWEVTAAMARLGDEKALQQLVFLANSGFSDAQTFSLLELAMLAEPKCTDLFKYRLAEGPHLETRLVAARGLGCLGYRDGLKLCLDTLKSSKPNLSPDVVRRDPPEQQIMRRRSMAALALGAIGDRSALPALQQAMRTGRHQVRAAAAKAIIEIVDGLPAGRSASGGRAR